MGSTLKRYKEKENIVKNTLLILILSTLCLSAQSINVGSSIERLESFKYETPNAHELKVPQDTKTVLITFKKDVSEFVNEYLSTKESNFLEKNKAVYIADINKMPYIITKLFALPALRDFKHTIYLHYEEEFQTKVPKKDEQVTVLKFENQKLKSISYISTKKQLKDVF